MPRSNTDFVGIRSEADQVTGLGRESNPPAGQRDSIDTAAAWHQRPMDRLAALECVLGIGGRAESPEMRAAPRIAVLGDPTNRGLHAEHLSTASNLAQGDAWEVDTVSACRRPVAVESEMRRSSSILIVIGLK